MPARDEGQAAGQVNTEWLQQFPGELIVVDRDRKILKLTEGWTFSSNDLWDDIQLLGISRLGASAPSLSAYRGGLFGLEFSATLDNSIHGAMELPHTYKEGTPLMVHVHWKTSSTNAAGGSVIWGIEYTVTDPAPGSTEGAPVTLQATETVAAASQQYLQHTFDLGAIPGTGLKISSLLRFRIYRLGATDTFAGGAWVDSFALHHQKDIAGSQAEWVKT